MPADPAAELLIINERHGSVRRDGRWTLPHRLPRLGTAGGEGAMEVLVCAASKYGATSEIAKTVGEVLAGKGLEVSVVPPGQAGPIEEFDAVVLGSAVYLGQWMRPARQLAERSAGALASRPVWLFSSGPVGEPARPADNPVDISKILHATKARDHQIFAGKLVRKHLSFPDRAVAAAIRAEEGDFRNWAEIRKWATGIADTLLAW